MTCPGGAVAADRTSSAQWVVKVSQKDYHYLSWCLQLASDYDRTLCLAPHSLPDEEVTTATRVVDRQAALTQAVIQLVLFGRRRSSL